MEVKYEEFPEIVLSDDQEYPCTEVDPTSMSRSMHSFLSGLLIFPKDFEFKKFANYCHKEQNGKIYHSTFNERKELYAIRSLRHVYICLVMKSSDAKFASDLLTFERHLNEPIHSPVFIIGSAGSTKPSELGKFFHISSAIKVDRGFLNSRSSDFTFEAEFRENSIYSEPRFTSTLELNSKKICSSNFLFKCYVPSYKEFLYDMETYEAFSVLRHSDKIKDYGCFRFVSDILHDAVPFDKLTKFYKKHKVDTADLKGCGKEIRRRCYIKFDFLFKEELVSSTRFQFEDIEDIKQSQILVQKLHTEALITIKEVSEAQNKVMEMILTKMKGLLDQEEELVEEKELEKPLLIRSDKRKRKRRDSDVIRVGKIAKLNT